MESKEDDAGIAASASHSASAREKDIGQMEDVNTSNEIKQQPTDMQTSQGATEENDGDSVPSPSTQDTNTSTEAILDMIDEIVDGPDAPKRVSLSNDLEVLTQDEKSVDVQNAKTDENATKDIPSKPPDPSTSYKDVNELQETEKSKLQIDNSELSDVNIRNVTDEQNMIPAEVPTLLKDDVIASSLKQIRTPNNKKNIASSSEATLSRALSPVSVLDHERTVQCVISSENRDNITIESAESTSSDNSVNESRTSNIEASSRSPLRRRLVRPLIPDRRPDMTVSSSTVDSQASQLHTQESTVSESTAKDVSSSSDAMPVINSEENTSKAGDTNICKAETSVSPIKKIKLIRQKITASASNVGNEIIDNLHERQQEGCQSTSDNVPSPKTEISAPSLLCNDTSAHGTNSTESVESPKLELKSFLNEPETEKSIDDKVKNNDIPQEPASVTLPVSQSSNEMCVKQDDEKKVPPIKLNLCTLKSQDPSTSSATDSIIEDNDNSETKKQVPKLTIKFGNKPEEKSILSKLTIKSKSDSVKSVNEIPNVTKLTIKPILKPPEKVNDIHRKSSSSEISESECSENDESTSTSDQASAPEEGKTETVPKVTIKIGKPEHDCESKTVRENIPKLTIKGILNENTDQDSNLTLIISQPDNAQSDKVPKMTIKSVKSEQHSPKLTIKPLKPQETVNCENPLLTKSKIQNAETPESMLVPKITIKAIKTDSDLSAKCPKKTMLNDDLDNIPIVTKLNIKPVVKPMELHQEENAPVISKLNKKSLKPKENDIDEIPKVTKLNIKPLVAPEAKNQEINKEENNIPIVTKINIKPIVKPTEVEKDMENQSSETGNSSDDNIDNVPVVTKLNIKPILKPESVDDFDNKCNDTIPFVTKLNIKPIIKPDDSLNSSSHESKLEKTDIPTVMKLNIKPVLKPEEIDDSSKHPPIVMKINMKSVTEIHSNQLDKDSSCKIELPSEHHLCNNVNEQAPVIPKLTIKLSDKKDSDNSNCKIDSLTTEKEGMLSCNSIDSRRSENVNVNNVHSIKPKLENVSLINLLQNKGSNENQVMSQEKLEGKKVTNLVSLEQNVSKQSAVQNCTLLKRLLENKSDSGLENKTSNDPILIKADSITEVINSEQHDSGYDGNNEIPCEKVKDRCSTPKIPEMKQDTYHNLSNPLEINTTDKEFSQSLSSGQNSPRIILKINKTDQGSSSKIITEDIKVFISNTETSDLSNNPENLHSQNRTSKKNIDVELSTDVLGKRLRSAKAVQESENSPIKRISSKRSCETLSSVNEDTDVSNLEAKRTKLNEILSNKSLTFTPVATKCSNTAAGNKFELSQEKKPNHTILNNENVSHKNGNSKLHSILSNLQSKQSQNSLSENSTENSNCIDKDLPEAVSSSVEKLQVENSHPNLQDIVIINDSSESHDHSINSEELISNPLEVPSVKNVPESPVISAIVNATPQPKKRGRPRKLPLSEGAKPAVMPVPAIEERPTRSLRLSRERPVVSVKPRGRGSRGRGVRGRPPLSSTPLAYAEKSLFQDEQLDPMSSRIKLPRLTEALDNMPSGCSTPLTSRRDSNSDMSGFKLMDSPRSIESEGRGRGRGRGRVKGVRGRRGGGGRGAYYMKETMGIYGRVCGPATTTVQLFEEETCMMDDNATPAKPSSHLLDEDSQSSVKSLTNDSTRMKKSKFADLFDSNKVWTAADVKEYMWPPPERPNSENQVMMIQEQIAMFLGVKGFKRIYPELKRRTITGEERDYVLSKGLVSEALCDLGITAIEASEVLDIMLSDYPHKYEDYRCHQRQRQIDEEQEAMKIKEEKAAESKIVKIEMKQEAKAEAKQEPKVDPEKARQELASAAVAAAAEWNARLNAARRPHSVDLQTLSIHTRRAPPRAPPRCHVRPPLGFYPLALLPGQFQQPFRALSAQQLRFFPLNTVLAAPPAPASPAPSSSEDERDDSDASSADDDSSRTAKRKRPAKPKRGASAEAEADEPPAPEERCAACGLREEANRKFSHERFLRCAACGASSHPSCLRLGADAVRKCRDYAWACAACKRCHACQGPPGPPGPPPSPAPLLFCDLCDRGFHARCVGLAGEPDGRWHCVECAICKSCGAREPSGSGGPSSVAAPGPATPAAPAEWHHHTKRGPGGHKVFSHSLCTPCARAYRIGRYCPLCDRSFIGPKGTMRLVICKLCDRQLHQECVRQAAGALDVMAYTCGECRRGGITSRAAAVRAAPKTIASLFMAKRRFNKYAHRQLLQARARLGDDSSELPDDADDSLQAEPAPRAAC